MNPDSSYKDRGSRRHRISTVFLQGPGRRADSLRIGRYADFLDTTLW